MMEYALDEDIPEEFKGGTLQLNEDKQLNDEKAANVHKRKSCDTTGKVDNENNNTNTWKDNITAPFTQLSSSMMNKKSVESTTNTVVQPSAIDVDRENANNFFTFRADIVDRAVRECVEEVLDPETDGDLIHCSLLTEINLWDTEKERLILLTTRTLVNIKYDFIALRRLEYRKIPLQYLDSVIIGDLVYPNGSLIPRLNGFADGISRVVQSCLLQKWSTGDTYIVDTFGPRNRNMQGIRIMWNKGQPVNFAKKWNPFCTDVPLCTFTSHPLFYHKDCTSENQRKLYDIGEFIDKLRQVLSYCEKADAYNCNIYQEKILLENYVGIGSLVHNRNALGFFKVRGKFSF